MIDFTRSSWAIGNLQFIFSSIVPLSFLPTTEIPPPQQHNIIHYTYTHKHKHTRSTGT